MKTPIYGIDEFRQLFKNTRYKDNFSDAGLQLLYNYLRDYENETKEDVIVSAEIIRNDFIELSKEACRENITLDFKKCEIVACDDDNDIYILRY